MTTLKVFFLMFLTFSVLCEQMDWGDNPDLVEEADPIQGREHIKLMVVMVGNSIDLECQVSFTSKPVSEIRWKIDGKRETKSDHPIIETKNGEVFVEDHLKLDNLTEDMDGSTVSCEYAKGQYGGSVEAVLQVFKLEIETSKDICDTCVGDIKLVFKESKTSSPAEATVDERIKVKIKEMTNLKLDDIKVDQSGYSVTLPIGTAQANQAILDMNPKLIKDGTPVTDNFAKCKCESVPLPRDDASSNFLVPLIIGIAAVGVIILLGGIWVSPLRGGKWGWRRDQGNFLENVNSDISMGNL